MLTDTFMPTVPPLLLAPPAVDDAFSSAMLRRISTSDFGALIVAAPRYVTPAKIVQS